MNTVMLEDSHSETKTIAHRRTTFPSGYSSLTPFLAHSLALLLPVVFCLCAGHAFADESHYQYTVDDGNATITGYIGPGGAISIPSTLDGYPVTVIGWSAFYNNTNIISVIIPDAVIIIEGHDLWSRGAFSGCSNLTSAIIGNGVITIGMYAFRDCISLASVAIPDSVTKIDRGAFQNCPSLTSVAIGNGVADIQRGAFWECTALTSITVGETNATYSSLDGVVFNKPQTTIIQYPGGKTGTYSIPNSVTNIEEYAFYFCTALTSVSISESVETIGWGAFMDCTSLTNVTIPDSVTEISGWAFRACTSLSSVAIGNSVTSIGVYAFLNCTALTNVTIPDTVGSIGGGAFYGCTSLPYVVIPDSDIDIEGDTFVDCTSLTNVNFGNGIRSIGSQAFMNCTSLQKLNIPTSVIGICDGAFSQCTGLQHVYFWGDAPSTNNCLGTGEIFDGVTGATAYYREGTSGWGDTYAGLPTALFYPSVVTWDPANPNDCLPVTIRYYPNESILQGSGQINIHIGRNGWIDTQTFPMAQQDTYWEYTYEPPFATYHINMDFNNGTLCDNNNGANWKINVANCSCVTWDPANPNGCVPVTIRYNPLGRPLFGAQQVYIHIGRNGWQNIIDPNPAMTWQGNHWSYIYDPAGGTEVLDFVFNDGDSIWDNNENNDWHVNIANCGVEPSPPVLSAFDLDASDGSLEIGLSETIAGAEYALYECHDLLEFPQVWTRIDETAKVGDGAGLVLNLPELTWPKNHYRIGVIAP